MLGAVFTVSEAAPEAASGGIPFLQTARNWCPSSPATALNVYGLAFAPGMSLHIAPPSVLTCHCTVGTGKPPAAEVKDVFVPAQTFWEFGLVVTDAG